MRLPPYPSFPEPFDSRVQLRQILPTDIAALLPISFYDAHPAASLEEALQMQASIDQDYAQGNSIHWGIMDRQNGQLVGTCGFYRGFANATGELGCVLLATSYGNGYMTSALQLATDFGFSVIGLKRITAFTSPDNQKAIRLLQRLRFIRTTESSTGETGYELLPAVSEIR